MPFGVTFDSAGHLVVAESSTDAAVATFTLNGNGTLTSLSAVPTGEAATCWIAPAQGFLHASNAGSASVSTYRSSFGGQLSLLGQTGTDPGNGRRLPPRTGANTSMSRPPGTGSWTSSRSAATDHSPTWDR